MNFENHQYLAERLRDQGLADLLCAKLGLRSTTAVVVGNTTSFAHMAVAKCQQSAEKLIKGFFLYSDPTFDPTKGHAPLTDFLAAQKGRSAVRGLIGTFGGTSKQLVQEIKDLESLAPRPPTVSQDQEGKQIPLVLVERNTEYPYWSQRKRRFVTPAEDFTNGDAVRAFRVASTLARIMSRVDPTAFTSAIASFLEMASLSYDVSSG